MHTGARVAMGGLGDAAVRRGRSSRAATGGVGRNGEHREGEDSMFGKGWACGQEWGTQAGTERAGWDGRSRLRRMGLGHTSRHWDADRDGMRRRVWATQAGMVKAGAGYIGKGGTLWHAQGRQA